MTEIKLYGYANSPFVRKTTCFLFYKGLDFTHIPVDPIKPKKTIAFTHKSQVPVLQIGEDWKLESSDHAYWLDEMFPEKPRETQSQFYSSRLAIGKTHEYKFARPATYSLFMAFCNPQSPIH